MKNLFYELFLMFGFTIKADNKEVRKLIYDYYFIIKEYTNILNYVTKVEVSKSKKKGLIVIIESHRPGVLIGKGGRDINGFKEFLFKELNRKDIYVDLKECELWHKLYS